VLPASQISCSAADPHGVLHKYYKFAALTFGTFGTKVDQV